MEQFDTIEFTIEYEDKIEEELGCEVIRASDAQEALRLFREKYDPLYFEVKSVEAD